MKRFLRSLSLFALLFAAFSAQAQVATGYSFSSTTGTYTAITGGTVNYSTSATSIDDGVYSALPIGFDFVFNGTTYTQFGYNGNGWMMLGSGIPSTSNTAISTGSSNNIIAAFNSDLIGRQHAVVTRTASSPVLTVTSGSTAGFTAGTVLSGTGIATGATVVSTTATTITMSANATSAGTGSHCRGWNADVRYETIGSAPNRQLVLQFTNFSRYSTSAAHGDRLSFQMVLEETTNKIYTIYNLGTPISATAVTNQIGLRGASSTDYNNRSTTTNWGATTAGGSNTAACSYSNTVVPASGMTFTWTPCNPPSAISVSNITGTTADVNWTAGNGATVFDVYYQTSATPAPTSATTPSVNNVSGTTTSLTGLTAATTYYLWVRSDCSPTTSAWIAATPSSFNTVSSTPPNCPVTITTPANAATGISLTASLNWSTATGAPSGYKLTMGSNSPDYNNLFLDQDLGNVLTYSPAGMLGGTTYGWKITPYNANGDATGCTFNTFSTLCPASTALVASNQTGSSFDIDWTQTGGHTAWDIYYSTLSTTPSNAACPGTAGFVCATATKPYTVSGLTAGTSYYVWVRPACSGGTANAWSSSLLTTTAYTNCNTATAISSVCTSNSFTLSGAGATGWNGTSGCGFTVGGQEKFYTFTPTVNGMHVLDVPSASSATWVDYVYKVAGGSCVPTGWTCINDYNSSTLTQRSVFGPLTAGTTYMLYMDAESTTATTQSFRISACTAPNTPTSSAQGTTTVTMTWTQGTPVNSSDAAQPAPTTWDIFYQNAGGAAPTTSTTPSVDNVTTNTGYVLSGLSAGTSYDIYVRSDCGGGLESCWVGPLTATTQNSCAQPSAFASSNVTSSSVDLTWAAGGSETIWDVYRATAATPVPNSGTTPTYNDVSNPYTASGLSAATTYYFWVRADCGLEQSTWLGPITVTTACALVSSFVQAFDGVTAPAFPTCWARVGAGGSVSTQTSGASSAPNCLYIYSSTTSSIGMMATIQVDNANANTHQLRFKTRGNFSSGGTMEAGYMTDNTNPATFVSLQAFAPNSNTAYQEVIVAPGTTPPSATVWFAFRHTGVVANSVLIDDVNWEPLPTCFQPATLTATRTGTTATLTWTPPSGGTPPASYEYAVTTSATPPASGTTTTNLSETVMGLAPATAHYGYVRSFCGGADYSSWKSVAFSTLRANDLCPDAITLTMQPDRATAVTNAVAMTAGFEGAITNPSCNTSGGQANDLWYKFVAPNPLTTKVHVECLASGDWVLVLYDACGGAEVACSDDANGNVPEIETCSLTPGNTYYVRAYPYTSSTTSTQSIGVYTETACTVPPPNDLCANAVVLSNDNTPATGTTLDATTTPLTNPSCDQFGNINDVWYKFNAGSMIKADLSFPVVQASPVVIKYHVLKGTCAAPVPATPVACGTAATAGTTVVTLNGLEANQDYFVRVWSGTTASGTQGTFSIALLDKTSTVEPPATPTGGVCLAINSVTINAANANNDRWVRITDASGNLIAEIDANGNNLGAITTGYYVQTGTERADQSTPPHYYVNRNFGITPATQPTGNPVDVRLYFLTSEFNTTNIPAANACQILRYAGQSCQPSFSGGQTQMIGLSSIGTIGATGTYLQFPTSAFSGFFANVIGQALPIELKSFTARAAGAINSIEWVTSAEINVREHLIERSLDGQTGWSTIATAVSKGEHGGQYRIDDSKPLAVGYYRLRSVDFDGQEQLSNVVAVTRERDQFGVTAVFPVPTDGSVNVQFEVIEEGNVQIALLDMTGRSVKTINVDAKKGVNQQAVSLSELTAGAYLLMIKNGATASAPVRVVKQ